MNINRYIEQAYSFFTGLAKELVKTLKDDNAKIVNALDHKDVTEAVISAGREVSNEVVGVNDQLINVIKAIEDKPVVESVKISNLDELSDGIYGVIDTLKAELGKIDKEIVVKNDLSQLTALFKSGEDKKDLIKALKKIEDKIKQPEITDYTLILDELTTTVQNIKIPEVNLTPILESLGGLSEKIKFLPEETFTYDKRIRVELSEKQLSKIGGGTVAVSGGGNSQAVIDALIGKATETTLQAIDTNLDALMHTDSVTGDKELRVYQEDAYLSNNSLTNPLGISESWTGTSVDTLGFGSISYSYISDKPTVTNGLYVEFSDDNVNWDKRIVNTYDAAHVNEVTDLTIRCHSRYFRMGIINGTSAQTYVRLHTILRRVLPSGDTMGVDHVPLSGDDAILTKSVIAGQTTAGGGSYVNVKVNPSGALTVESTVTSSTLPTGAATEATLAKLNGFSIPVYDYISLGYTGSNLTTVTYKTGGSSGTTVATLTIAYDGSNNITSVTKS